MATPARVSTERRVENLKAFMVKLARSNHLLLPEMKLFEQKFLELCLSPTPEHPTYAAMIFTAIAELNEERGSSEEAISEFIKSKYNGLPYAHASLLSHHLAKLVEKEEIFRDYNNCYLFPRENTSASTDYETTQVKIKSRSSCCGNRNNYQCVIEGKDHSQVDQGLTTEAVTCQNAEESDRILQYEERKFKNGGIFLEEQGLMTEAETCPEREANGATLPSEKLEAVSRDQPLGEHDQTAETQVLAEKDKYTVCFQSKKPEDQYMHNCVSLGDGKQKQKLGNVRCHEEDMQVEHLEELHGASGNFVQGPKDKTQEESVMINREDEENLVLRGDTAVIDEVRQTENRKDKVSLGKVETPKNDGLVEREHVALEWCENERRIEANNEEDKSQKTRGQEDERCRMHEVNGSDEQENEMTEELSYGEEQQIGISSNPWKVQSTRYFEVGKEACAKISLKRDEMGGETEVICEEQSQKKPELKEQTHKAVVAEVEAEQEDKTELEQQCGGELKTEKVGGEDQPKDKKSNTPRAQVRTLQDISDEIMCEPEALSIKVSEAHRRLWEQQTEACNDIVALKKMLKCARNQEQNEGVSAMGSSFSVQHNVAPLISLPLSKESCIQLWKLVHKIQGQLFDIISSFDKTEIPYETSGHKVESIRKGSPEEGYRKAKIPCKQKESEAFSPSTQLEYKKRNSGSQQKPLIVKISAKKPDDIERTTLGGLYANHKQAKLCDPLCTSILASNGRPCDSSVGERAETGHKSTKAISNGDEGEVRVSAQVPQLERECQSEKSNLTSGVVMALPVVEERYIIEKLQQKARSDQGALQIEATNRPFTEPTSTSPSKCIVEDGHNRFYWKNAWAQPEGKANLDVSFMDTCFSDHPNNKKKQIQKKGWKTDNNLGRVMSTDVEMYESEPQLSGQPTSQATDQRKEVDDHDPSQPGSSTRKSDLKPSPQHTKRRGRPPKRNENTEVSEDAKLLKSDNDSHIKQGPLRTQKLSAESDAPSTKDPRMQRLTKPSPALPSTQGRFTGARAAAAAAEASFSE